MALMENPYLYQPWKSDCYGGHGKSLSGLAMEIRGRWSAWKILLRIKSEKKSFADQIRSENPFADQIGSNKMSLLRNHDQTEERRGNLTI